MGLFNFNKDTEKEVSSGVLIGYVLIGFAIVLVVAFLIFVGYKKITSKPEVDNQIATEQNIESSSEVTPEN